MARLSEFHREYWNAFQGCARDEESGLPEGNHSNSYMIFRLGVGGAHLAASVLVSRNLVTFYLLLEGKHRDEMYHHLYVHEAEIDAELRETPVWTVITIANRTRVTVELNVDDLANRQDWSRQHRWIIGKERIFDNAFRRRLQELKGTR